jgi:hypothetical protein
VLLRLWLGCRLPLSPKYTRFYVITELKLLNFGVERVARRMPSPEHGLTRPDRYWDLERSTMSGRSYTPARKDRMPGTPILTPARKDRMPGTPIRRNGRLGSGFLVHT